jgi:peptidoglycan/LPS O-acetylase OafA/YrhL
VVIFGVSQFFANTIKKFNTTFGKAVKLFGFYILGAAALVVIGFFMGFSFLCIKLTLYYMPFFFLGHLYGTFQEQIQKLKCSTVITEVVVMLSLGIFVLLLNKFSIYNIGEGIIGIAIRILASTTGCIAICGICSHTKDLFAKWGGTIQHIGAYTLEIYLVHYLVLSLFKQNYPLMSARGILSVVFNFTVTLTLSLIATKILNSNSVMKKILLGKMK